MALYLRNQIADTGLLAYPFESFFDYQALLQFCRGLNGKTQLSMDDWKRDSNTAFGFSPDQTELYFQTFKLISDSQIVTPVAFVLFLYNQLYNAPRGLSSSVIKPDTEFPNIKEESHDPLGLVLPHYSSRMSVASLDEVECEDHQTTKLFAGAILEHRHKLAAFWRRTVRKWMILIQITLYGFSEPRLTPIILLDMAHLELFFTPVSTCFDSPEFLQIQSRFHSWIASKSEIEVSFEPSEPKGLKSLQVSFSEVTLKELFLNMQKSKAGIQTELEAFHFDEFLSWFQWSIMERPASYELLEIATHGVCNRSETHYDPILSFIPCPEVLFCRRKGLLAAVPPAFTLNRTIILHCLHNCEIYLIGPAKNVIISKCRNTTVFAGVVQGHINIRSSLKCTVMTCCRGITISDDNISSLLKTGGHTIFMNVATRPFLETPCTPEMVPTFSPLNSWYKGMCNDIAISGLGFEQNLWNWPIISHKSDHMKAFNLLSPSKFFLNEIPFDVVDEVELRLANAAEGESMVTNQVEFAPEFLAIFQNLPEKYALWIKESWKLAKNAQAIMEKAKTIDPTFSEVIQKHYESWMDSKSLISSLNNLQKAVSGKPKINVSPQNNSVVKNDNP